MNSKLDVLPRFTIRNISPVSTPEDNVIVDGTFAPAERIRAGDRGWLFATDTDWPLADVVSLDADAARLDVHGWTITSPLEAGLSLPWLSIYWNARDVAFLMDPSKQWRRVEYQATDAVRFAQKDLKCVRCDRVVDAAHPTSECPWCGGKLVPYEMFGEEELGGELQSNRRFIEIRRGGWDHDHCLICDAAIGRTVSHGYREASFAGGRNSVGIWLCEECYQKYVETGDFSFLL